MKTGPKYKIARRLGASIFEKTQTQKYALSEGRKSRQKGRGRRPKNLSEYGRQLIEKQKVRYTYLLSEKQFSRYVKEAMASKGKDTAEQIYQSLERRLDNIVFKLGFAHTRGLARQLVSHGHITVNGKKLDISSYRAVVGDKIAIKLRVQSKPIFYEREDMAKGYNPPSWLKSTDIWTGEMVGLPKASENQLLFDITSVIEFYSR